MDKEYVRQLLPEEPRDGLLQWAMQNCNGELGPGYLVWRSERVLVYDMEYLMDECSKSRYERVARCKCTCCNSEMLTEYSGTTLAFWIDECGEWWPMHGSPLDPEGEVENGYTAEVKDGEELICPMCYEPVRTIQEKKLRGGRHKQVLVVSIETIEQYAAVVYWLARRDIAPEGEHYSVYPRDAYVLDERGTIHRYTHTTGGGSYRWEEQSEGWRLASNKRDAIDKVYHDWGSINSKKKGGIFFDDVPDLAGSTAEKTGLQVYAEVDGTYSVEYLKLWKKFPNLENLLNTGWIELVDRVVVNSALGYDAKSELEKVVDISQRKPHDMLGMSRGDFKQIRRNGWQWGFEEQLLYDKFLNAGFGSALDFRRNLSTFTKEGLRAVHELQQRYGDANLDKLTRYLHKQNMLPREVRILLDTRNAALALAGGRPLTTEELWPRNLSATHDRLARQRALQISPDMAKKYQQGFDDVRSRYSELQWNDGDLCVVLPKGYADLVQEGNVLRHCVGGYSQSHITGSHTIFFIRHYRRPERCYYTLDINMKEGPYRNQLHGYGNERHGKNKEHRHTIPKKVLDFCDRWEKEVLMPWYRNQQNIQKEGTTT